MDWLMFFAFFLGAIVVIVVLWFLFAELFGVEEGIFIIGQGSDNMSIGKWVPPEESERRQKSIDELYPED